MFLLIRWSHIDVVIIWLRPILILCHTWLWRISTEARKFTSSHRISLFLNHLSDQSLVCFLFIFHNFILIWIERRRKRTRLLLRRLAKRGVNLRQCDDRFIHGFFNRLFCYVLVLMMLVEFVLEYSFLAYFTLFVKFQAHKLVHSILFCFNWLFTKLANFYLLWFWLYHSNLILL